MSEAGIGMDLEELSTQRQSADEFENAPSTVAEAEAQAASMDIADIRVGNPKLFQNGVELPYFRRLRDEDPIHLAEDSPFGPYWSITRYADIMEIDKDHQRFSSDSSHGGIIIGGTSEGPSVPMFIAMDPPKHDIQRATVAPVVAPPNLKAMEPLIRERASAILDGLPIGETFDWVDLVSKELTAMTLATLFDFPQEDRRKLTHWSDVATSVPGDGLTSGPDEWALIMMECHQAFDALWKERLEKPGENDLLSMLTSNPETREMPPLELFGNMLLLIVGGNDTTRNTITGSIYALNQNPDEYAKLKADRSLIPNMVSETIRWQTPLAHMRRTAVADVEMGGKTIRSGDKVVMWYVSGNRDDRFFEEPDAYRVDRQGARSHTSFGYGIHRCVGNRLAELQLKIIWEEIMNRFPHIEVVEEPSRVLSSFVRGYREMKVRIPARH